MVNNKILFCMFLAALVLVSSVSATNFTIINDSNYTFIFSEGPIYPINITFDTIPPVISNVRAMQMCTVGINCKKEKSFIILWNTNKPSYFNKVEYGRGDRYDFVVSQQHNINSTVPGFPQSALLLTLDKPGNYHYKVTSCDMFGKCATSGDYKVKNKNLDFSIIF